MTTLKDHMPKDEKRKKLEKRVLSSKFEPQIADALTFDDKHVGCQSVIQPYTGNSQCLNGP